MKKKSKIKELTSTSKFLAREIVHYIGKSNKPISILQLCPSSHVITEAIIEKMNKEDSLTIYIMRQSCDIKIKKEIFSDKRVKIAYKNMETLVSKEKFDYIIIDFPINRFEPPIVSEMMNKLISLLKDDAILAYYENINIDRFKRKIFNDEKWKKSLILKQLIINLLKNYEFKREKVFLNFPPLYVHYLHNRY